MFSRRQLIAACFAITSLGSAGGAVTPETQPDKDASSATKSASARAEEVVEIRDLQPFTHIAYIPVGAVPSSLKVEGVKAVQLATRLRYQTNPQYCEERLAAEPATALDCSRTTAESRVPAYEVSYSFSGQPMASDEYGITHFTFSVYFRADELSPEVRRAISAGVAGGTNAAEFFQLTTSKDSVHQMVIDEAHSTFCDGNYVDGNWVPTNTKCDDDVRYEVVAGPSSYITVIVDPVSSRLETAEVRTRAEGR